METTNKNAEQLMLVQRAKSRDPDAFVSLMQLQAQNMYRIALAILLNDEDAADAIQDTILTCWEKIATLREERFFRTWMTRILIHKCYDLRNTRRTYADWDEIQEPAAEDHYNLELKEALASLDEKYRVVMILFYAEGYKTDEIARLLQIPKSTVQTRLQRGREKLARYYKNGTQEDIL